MAGSHHSGSCHSGSHHSSSSHSGSYRSSSSSSRSRSSSSHHYYHSGTSYGGSSGGGSAQPSNPLLTRYTFQRDKRGKRLYVNSPSVFERGLEPEPAIIHGYSWIMGNAYCIDTRDPYFKNYKPVKTGNAFVAFFFAFVLLVLGLSNSLYEELITIFEELPMTDEAFAFADDFIYYGQVVIPLLWIAYIIISRIVRKIAGKRRELSFAKQMMDYYQKADIQEAARLEQEYQRSRTFYEFCPGCGAPRSEGAERCFYCDTNLETTKI